MVTHRTKEVLQYMDSSDPKVFQASVQAAEAIVVAESWLRGGASTSQGGARQPDSWNVAAGSLDKMGVSGGAKGPGPSFRKGSSTTSSWGRGDTVGVMTKTSRSSPTPSAAESTTAFIKADQRPTAPPACSQQHKTGS
ncbi:hypothetical protein N1851_034184 [Merluccius polli]|uniref:Uncharacterized protein n=1 Tax=Merluccius polli TaxID=89951 RepID=A0AA47M023_MERPO|nr:hypothetical protein N1851_034184 [Merluccius polli]